MNAKAKNITDNSYVYGQYSSLKHRTDCLSRCGPRWLCVLLLLNRAGEVDFHSFAQILKEIRPLSKQ